MKKWISGAVCAVLLLSLAACASNPDVLTVRAEPLAVVKLPDAIDFEDYDARSAVREQNPVEDGFLSAINGFAYETASALLKDSAANENYSPLSLYYALALAGAGAGGGTQAQILALLGADSADALSAQCGNLFRRLYSDNEATKLKLANSLWMDADTAFKDGFVQNAAENFYAESYLTDFADKAAGKAMGEWISKNTNGTLSPDIETQEEDILAIINTVYLKDQWVGQFKESENTDAAFHAPGGDVQATYMNAERSGSYTDGEGFTRASLGLLGGGEMVFVLPDEGVSVSSLLASPERVRDAFEGGEEQSGMVLWQLPKFSFDSEYDLPDTLKALGVTDAFRDDADFTGMTDQPARITGVIQQTHIAIDENGVEASAFTLVIMTATGMPMGRAEMILDRPFIYGITAAGGALLFVGVCNNPAA